MGRAKISTASSGFINLLITESLGAFNDNAFKVFVTLIAAAVLSAQQMTHVIALAGFCFILPFIVFSAFAGSLADKFSKKKIIVVLKGVEVALMAFALLPLSTLNIPLLLVLLALMGTHSALFGPVKLAIVPELLEENNISHGNGLMSMMAFVGIIAGTAGAALLMSVVHGRYYLGALAFIAVALTGFISSLFIGGTDAVNPSEKLELNLVRRIAEDIKDAQSHVTIYRSLAAGAYFWFVGAMFQMNIIIYGKEMMKVGETTLGLFQMVVALGIGLGSVAAGRLSKHRVELGLVPVGALGMVVFSFALAFGFGSTGVTYCSLFMLGFSGGLFVLPLTAYVQYRSPANKRGKFIAVGNILSFTGVLLASGFLWMLSGYLVKLNPAQIFIVLGIMTLVVALYIMSLMPELLIRLCVYPVANIIYRIKVRGYEHVPLEGGALLASNHISFVDAALLIGACQRPVRFVMHKKYYNMPGLKYLFKMAKCVPISHSGGPHEISESLNAARAALLDGELVCIFVEGEISRHGQMLRFRKGYERIVQGLDIPVIAVHIDGVWGRLFSFEGGSAVFKWPRAMAYPVTVSFGQQLPPSTDTAELRLAMQELSAGAFRNRLEEKLPLPLEFAKEAKKHWFRFAMADSTGARLTHGAVLVRAAMLARALERVLPAAENVGLLVPPSVGGALSNVAVSLLGKVPVNLNYTMPRDTVLACAEKAGVEKIITSKKLAEKMGWPVSDKMIFLEDIAAGISKLEGTLLGAAFFCLPFFVLRRAFFSTAEKELDATAAVIFTSGSSGEPKGVMLSHFNIHANMEAMAQIYQIIPSDRIVGVLPFFHSFGYTVTLWLPLTAGFGAVYHYNPLEAQTVGRLAEKYKASMLLGTPTFLAAYIRKVEVRQFRYLRLAMTGAEKLREEVAFAFKEKFGLLPLEGYGCTELSPVASLNTPDVDIDGVRQSGGKMGTIGRPLPGIAMKVVNPETFEQLDSREPGLLLVRGPNIMKGYLGNPEKTASVMRDGYYVTGDIASIDEDGFVTITDRMSRFSKIGGEMVPHIKIEEKLHQLAGVIDRTFVVSSVPDEKRGEKLVVLYVDIAAIDDLYAKLKTCGLPNLWVPERAAFHKIDLFPVLGSGKLDMGAVKRLALDLERSLAAAPGGSEGV